jgi:hypothetical protein
MIGPITHTPAASHDLRDEQRREWTSDDEPRDPGEGEQHHPRDDEPGDRPGYPGVRGDEPRVTPAREQQGDLHSRGAEGQRQPSEVHHHDRAVHASSSARPRRHLDGDKI